ncbi:MAG: hypothetical protein BJ554DRAFT_7193 [Olpidium bornovanus]|uniref:Uncharacterized protein n=1 Tax=Olpidium bornovanus TaxID=278681 RepID=A0A8H7ZWD6_9FUNG|nr:MAG: hypothetical protein BJ554DRAFT_7193 [Olpidium bornovanus]
MRQRRRTRLHAGVQAYGLSDAELPGVRGSGPCFARLTIRFVVSVSEPARETCLRRINPHRRGFTIWEYPSHTVHPEVPRPRFQDVRPGRANEDEGVPPALPARRARLRVQQPGAGASLP